jgi:hypothetical protein
VYSQTHPIEQHPDLMALRAASEGATARPAAQAAECFSLLAGVFLAISPWVVGFHATAPRLTVNNLITGLVLVVLSLGFVPAYERTHSSGMTAALIGVWTIIAPWVIRSTPTGAGVIATNVITGAMVFLLAAMTLAQGMGRSQRRSGAAGAAPMPTPAPERPMPPR